jgi:hypothetical protein
VLFPRRQPYASYITAELDLQITVGRALMAASGMAAPEMGETYARTRSLAEQLNYYTLIVLFRCFLANISFTTSDPSIDWRLLTEHIQRLGEAQSDVAVELLGRHLTGILRLFLGEFDVNSLKP